MRKLVILLLLAGCAQPPVNPTPRDAAIAVKACYDRGGRALYLLDEQTGAYGIFCEEPEG